MKLIFATRPSKLARWQTQWVINSLLALHPGLECEEKIITTQGDQILDKPLPEIGGKGLFTQELESELLSGAVHCAVHSLKDLPVENPAGRVGRPLRLPRTACRRACRAPRDARTARRESAASCRTTTS